MLRFAAAVAVVAALAGAAEAGYRPRVPYRGERSAWARPAGAGGLVRVGPYGTVSGGYARGVRYSSGSGLRYARGTTGRNRGGYMNDRYGRNALAGLRY